MPRGYAETEKRLHSGFAVALYALCSGCAYGLCGGCVCDVYVLWSGYAIAVQRLCGGDAAVVQHMSSACVRQLCRPVQRPCSCFAVICVVAVRLLCSSL